jgi:hypothetical protein
MWLTMGHWTKVLTVTEQFVKRIVKADKHNYSYVLILKGFAYNGIAHIIQLTLGMAKEALERHDEALHVYTLASDYIQSSQPIMSYYAIQKWVTKIIYRLCILCLRFQGRREALAHFRRYKNLVETNFKLDFGFDERLRLYYWYWRTLSDLLKKSLKGKGAANARSPENNCE